MGFYIFCDESLKAGKKYSNFYGGVIIRKSDFEWVKNALLSKMQALNLEDSELKWQNINVLRLEPYKIMMDVFFELVKQDIVKVRIMFTDNRLRPTKLTENHKNKQYHILYYHFLKHAFGLKYISSKSITDLEVFFDNIPDKEEKNREFKRYVFGLQFLPDFQEAKMQIKEDSIYEVDSKNHILMQCLDVVLGAMAFRLNDMHKEKPVGQLKRGKRTVAKEKVYQHINKLIREIRPNFNIGMTTGIDGNVANRLAHSYRHWLFVPSAYEYEEL